MKVKKKLKDYPIQDLPREKLIKYGPENLTDSELIALILRSGGTDNTVLDLSQKLLSEYKTLKNLFNQEYEQLTNIKNIGEAKAACLKAAGEIGKRITQPDTTNKIILKTPLDVYEYIRKDLFNQTKEHLYLITVDTRNCFISKDLISVGTINETLIHPREIFKIAVAKSASGIILAHNHPSGDPTPSSNDLNTTERISKAGIIMGIGLIDHIVVTDNEFKSVKSLLNMYSGGGENK